MRESWLPPVTLHGGAVAVGSSPEKDLEEPGAALQGSVTSVGAGARAPCLLGPLTCQHRGRGAAGWFRAVQRPQF